MPRNNFRMINEQSEKTIIPLEDIFCDFFKGQNCKFTITIYNKSRYMHNTLLACCSFVFYNDYLVHMD